MLLHCFVPMNFGLFWVPKTIQKWTPNHVHNRLPFRHVFSAQLGPILGPFWAPQIRPKIACLAMLALLAALELHFGTPRSSPSQLGLLRRPFGALRGGAFALHFGLPGSHFDPPWLHCEALLGSLGAFPMTFASTHFLSQRCSEAHADKTMYDMIKPRPGGVRGSV